MTLRLEGTTGGVWTATVTAANEGGTVQIYSLDEAQADLWWPMAFRDSRIAFTQNTVQVVQNENVLSYDAEIT